MNNPDSVLVTGAAGFIGFHTCQRLIAQGRQVIGVDSINDYYDPSLKRARLAQLTDCPSFSFTQLDLCDGPGVTELFARHRPVTVIHLAAQAGVRFSLQQPHAYIQANLVGFTQVLEQCRQAEVAHFVYASSSSVYGHNSKLPFSVHDMADHPVSLYAATKRANELLAHTYSHLYNLPATGLRFFTVYGPWGRPDMAYYRFTAAIQAGEPITVYGDGSVLRDFTYVDDIVEGIVRIAAMPAAADPDWSAATPDPGASWAPWRVYNIGHGQQATLNELIDTLGDLLGHTPQRITELPQPGDVPVTHAETTDLNRMVEFTPQVSLREGMARFVDWYRGYYGGDT